ncbi:MAG TPA: rRNA maturation RNase YbeY [Nitrospiraceae bacterium]|nr:rRNA maturation RNase YbeY [Nitrospiraceae bacterium]
MKKSAVIIRIKDNQRKQKLATARIKSKLRVLLTSLGLPEAELSILFIGDHAMRSLNRRYRGKDKATDVLSFPMREGAFSSVQPHILGDIVISIPTALNQAKKAASPLSREIDRLLVHGLLHLVGHDHEQSRRGAETMKKKERKLLKRLRQ